MISLILPVYNERDALSRNLDRIVRELSKIGEAYEIIIAEDGSADGSYPLAMEISRKHPMVRLSHSDDRLGKGLAIKRALSLAGGDKIAYMDIDLSPDICSLGDMIRQLDSYDIVIGSRMMRRKFAKRKLRRYAFSLAYNLIIRSLFRTGIRDHQCGFKGFRRDVLLDLAPRTVNDRWFFDTELLINANDREYMIRELPIEWEENARTKIIVSWVIFHMMLDILRFLSSGREAARQQ
jgi:glycosyltransferase involved in cell wall biosynthesis